MATKKTHIIPINKYNRPDKKSTCEYIVIHWTADVGATAEQLDAYYHNVARGSWPDSPNAWTSANYIVGYDGTLITCIYSGNVSYGVSGYNERVINIEVCIDAASGIFTGAAVQTLADLVQRLMRSRNVPAARVVRHYDLTGKLCPRYYALNADAWRELHMQITGQTPPSYRLTITDALSESQRGQIVALLESLGVKHTIKIV